jgi:cell division protein FtsW (lipid II flippase)
VNVGVVTGALPTKGLPLPFLSFGGSALLTAMFSAGVLLNISQHATHDDVWSGGRLAAGGARGPWPAPRG